MTLHLDSPISTFGTACTPIVAIHADQFEKFITSASAIMRSWIAATGFVAKPHTHSLIPSATGAIDTVLVGVGDVNDLFALSHLPLTLPEANYTFVPNAGSLNAYAAAFGWQMGSYQFSRYKKPLRQPAALVMANSAETRHAVNTFISTKLIRDLVNTPSEDLGPEQMADCAQQLALEFGAIFREWAGDNLLKHNFPAIHAVGRASDRAPRLIELTWGEPKNPRVAVVGKGVCFDTGGVNIKGADGMRWMKKDMGGGAHALGLARLIMAEKLPVYLHMLVPAVENSISGNAYRPGDVIATRKGLSVEIGNTDAEGRVILADALAFAAESDPAIIIDFATLTGAARVALGPELPAIFCNDESWTSALIDASKKTCDPLWRMPLWQPYNALIEPAIADLNNTGGPQAGAVTAALFLEHFIPKGQAWIHIDLFAWNPKSRPGRPEGGEAQTLRATLEMLRSRFNS